MQIITNKAVFIFTYVVVLTEYRGQVICRGDRIAIKNIVVVLVITRVKHNIIVTIILTPILSYSLKINRNLKEAAEGGVWPFGRFSRVLASILF